MVVYVLVFEKEALKKVTRILLVILVVTIAETLAVTNMPLLRGTDPDSPGIIGIYSSGDTQRLTVKHYFSTRPTLPRTSSAGGEAD